MLNRLIGIARGQLGICEQPMGSNDIIYNHAYWGERNTYADLPWCVVFQWWCCKQAGVPFPATAHCNAVEQYAKTNGQWVTGGYQPGDFVIFDYDKNLERDHIGLVIEVNGSSMTTIEGNYGDKVAKVVRSIVEPVGAYRPDYGEDATDMDVGDIPSPVPAPEPVDGDLPTIQNGDCGIAVEADAALHLPVLAAGSTGTAVGALQVLLRFHGHALMNSFYRNSRRPDCEFGPETERALLEQCGTKTTNDGVWRRLIGGADK